MYRPVNTDSWRSQTSLAALAIVLALVSPAAAVEFAVQGNQLWQATGVLVVSGDVLQITSSGCIAVSSGDLGWAPSGCACPYSPGGVCNSLPDPGPDYLVPHLGNRYALVGRIGTAGEAFVVGDDFDGTVAQGGELYLACNDDAHGDNSMSWLCEIVLIRCDCTFQADMDGSSFLDAVDLANLIDIVYFGGLDHQDPDCSATRADFNADGVADAVDLALMIDHVFFGGPGPTQPCAI
ncbi:MAG: hypothetical protein AB1752_09690 [Candidatus Zixiibacteriota bacterium]